jgi:hypothetical protein
VHFYTGINNVSSKIRPATAVFEFVSSPIYDPPVKLKINILPKYSDVLAEIAELDLI